MDMSKSTQDNESSKKYLITVQAPNGRGREKEGRDILGWWEMSPGQQTEVNNVTYTATNDGVDVTMAGTDPQEIKFWGFGTEKMLPNDRTVMFFKGGFPGSTERRSEDYSANGFGLMCPRNPGNSSNTLSQVVLRAARQISQDPNLQDHSITDGQASKGVAMKDAIKTEQEDWDMIDRPEPPSGTTSGTLSAHGDDAEWVSLTDDESDTIS